VKFTAKQSAVVRLVVLGYTDDRIAEELGIPRTTVAERLRTIYGSMGAHQAGGYNPRALLVVRCLTRRREG